MLASVAFRIFIGVFAYAIIRGTVLGYWRWRKRRLAVPAYLRNAGFVTDAKLWIFERGVLSIFVLHAAAILAFIIWFVGSTWGWWAHY